MTPIGHFTCASAVAGTADVISWRETAACYGYYALFLIVFAVSAHFFAPGPWAMHLHDWAGNLALLFFLLLWSRRAPRMQAFVCLLIGGQVLSAYTHMFDVIVLKLTGQIPTGMWRPHNILHTPLAALVVSLVATPLVGLVTRGLSRGRIFCFLLLGYLLHIFADTVTYGYPIYLFWPLHPYHVALIDVFQRPEVASPWLGNPLYIFSLPSQENTDGFIVYKAEVAVNLLLGALVAIKAIVRRIMGGMLVHGRAA